MPDGALNSHLEFRRWSFYSFLMRILEDAAQTLSKAIDPRKLASLRASKATSQRVESLVQKLKDGGITKAEKAELEQYQMLNQIMSLVKARARMAAVSA